ncbi:MAG TPA: YtxH domain-containing protein [Candidatus Micrarchaeia archaeon]|nr:YtxH domain-containing protein [Candidatus Micrarchaeia archaeon]
MTGPRGLPAVRPSGTDRLGQLTEWPQALPVAARAARRRWLRPMIRYRRGFTRGLGIGLAIGVLYAPRSGRESRALLATAVRWSRRVRRTLRWLRPG